MADPPDRSLDEIYRAYLTELAAGREHLSEATGIAFQYQVAKAQVRWALISAAIAAASVVVAFAARMVAVLN